MKTKIVALGLIAVVAGVFAYTRQHNAVPSDLRDAVADNGAIGQLQGDSSSLHIQEPIPEVVNKGVLPQANTYLGEKAKPVEFVVIPGGKFIMGNDSGMDGFLDAAPSHEVTIKTFEMSRTLVTVEQYAECVLKGECVTPATGGRCNWGKAGRQLHPVNCVSWLQAQAYARFKGARLPSEAEFEYASTSGGKRHKYPWGNDDPTCDKAVIKIAGAYDCAVNGTMPVCSKPAGNTAQGLCDMAGNVWQWVQDKYHYSYDGVPVDGRAFEDARSRHRVIRGAGFVGDVAKQAGRRGYALQDKSDGFFIGVRLARSKR